MDASPQAQAMATVYGDVTRVHNTYWLRLPFHVLERVQRPSLVIFHSRSIFHPGRALKFSLKRKIFSPLNVTRVATEF